MKTLAVLSAAAVALAALPAMGAQITERYTTGTAKIIEIEEPPPENYNQTVWSSTFGRERTGTYVYDLWGNPIFVPDVQDYQHQGAYCNGFLAQSGPERGRCYNTAPAAEVGGQ